MLLYRCMCNAALCLLFCILILCSITTIIVDEAGCVPDSYMPLLTIFPRVERILCFGDPKQLPPFTHQPAQLIPLPSFMGRCELRFAQLPAKSKTFATSCQPTSASPSS